MAINALPEKQPHPQDKAVPESLRQVLDQSEKIQDVVEECAEELSSVNTALKRELSHRTARSGVESALQKSESIENKVHVCADDLTQVNRALEQEVKVRQALELQLADMRRQAKTARHESLHDALTGLPNRVLFADRLKHGLTQARRHGWTLSVMFIDLDDFKRINDTHGHAAGDQVLRAVAHRLDNMKRAEDTVCRRGGDEFLYLLLELSTRHAAAKFAEKIIRTISEPCDITVGELVIRQSVKPSIGIAIFPKNGVGPDELIEHADQAMYVAKQNKDGYSFGAPAEPGSGPNGRAGAR